MGSGALLGIDIGTTGVRAAVFAVDGRRLADASVPCAHDAPQPGWAEADPEGWWRAIVRAIGEVGRTARLADIASVAVVGQAPTVVLLDATGAVVRPAILWLDTRADAEATVLGTQAYYLGPKLAWLARHEPQSLAKARWLLQSHAFVAQRLTDAAALLP